MTPEIKPGQHWRRRDGSVRTIIYVQPPMYAFLYPVADNYDEPYTLDGRFNLETPNHDFDLVELLKPCPNCNGDGVEEDAQKGAGYVAFVTCNSCGGTGWTADEAGKPGEPHPPAFMLNVTANGSLVSSAPFVSWTPNHTAVCLDGDFTLDDLRSIIQQIEQAKKASTP